MLQSPPPRISASIGLIKFNVMFFFHASSCLAVIALKYYMNKKALLEVYGPFFNQHVFLVSQVRQSIYIIYDLWKNTPKTKEIAL